MLYNSFELKSLSGFSPMPGTSKCLPSKNSLPPVIKSWLGSITSKELGTALFKRQNSKKIPLLIFRRDLIMSLDNDPLSYKSPRSFKPDLLQCLNFRAFPLNLYLLLHHTISLSWRTLAVLIDSYSLFITNFSSICYIIILAIYCYLMTIFGPSICYLMCVTSPQIQDLVELHKFLYVLHVHETHLGDSSTNILIPMRVFQMLCVSQLGRLRVFRLRT